MTKSAKYWSGPGRDAAGAAGQSCRVQRAGETHCLTAWRVRPRRRDRWRLREPARKRRGRSGAGRVRRELRAAGSAESEVRSGEPVPRQSQHPAARLRTRSPKSRGRSSPSVMSTKHGVALLRSSFSSMPSLEAAHAAGHRRATGETTSTPWCGSGDQSRPLRNPAAASSTIAGAPAATQQGTQRLRPNAAHSPAYGFQPEGAPPWMNGRMPFDASHPLRT
jgi:hypothetical protein